MNLQKMHDITTYIALIFFLLHFVFSFTSRLKIQSSEHSLNFKI